MPAPDYADGGPPSQPAGDFLSLKYATLAERYLSRRHDERRFDREDLVRDGAGSVSNLAWRLLVFYAGAVEDDGFIHLHWAGVWGAAIVFRES